MDARPETRASLHAKLKALDPADGGARNAIVCALIGHSSIVTYCFGYVSCSRCEAQLGDTLAGAYSLKDSVIVGHDCARCQTNYSKLGWRDKLYARAPFRKAV